ncbi:MAG: hypothetical protein WKF67_13060 [Rubrobacteraceae bacterium]
MSNQILDKAIEQADLIDTWIPGKFRFYAIDMNDAGPAVGAWAMLSGGLFSTPSAGVYEHEYTTNAAHGLVLGEKIALFGITGSPPSRANSAIVNLHDYRKPTTSNGKKYRCIKTGTTGASEGTWPTIDGELKIDGGAGGVVWMCDGPVGSPYANRNWTISSVPATNKLRVLFNSVMDTASGAGAFVASLDKTYLSEFAPPAGRTAMSSPLTGKTVLPGPVLDCNDSSLDLTVADSSEVILLVKTAALDADVDLADTAQRIIAYFDTMPSLPIVANAGVTALAVSNTADRLMRL